MQTVAMCDLAHACDASCELISNGHDTGKTKITAPQGILELDDMNWWEALHTYDSVMVQFYAPWCWHCQDLEPAYVQAAAILKGDENPVAFAKMDRTLPWHYELCSAWGVPSITPTLRFFRHGVPTIYDGERTTTSLTNWVKKRSGPLWETITTVEELTELKNNHDIFVVVALEDLNSMHLHHCVVQAASEAAGRVKYAITNSSAVIKKLKAKVPSAVLLRNFDQPRTVHFPTEKFNASLCFLDGYSHDISEWVDEYKYPLLLSYTESGIEVHNKLYPKIIPSVMWFFVDDDAADFIAIRKEARAFAAQHKGTVLTMFATESNDASQVMKHFGMKPSDMPCAMLATLNSKKHKQDQFIVPDHNIGAEGLTEFVKNIQGGVGSPAHIRSEDPKPSDMQGKPFDNLFSPIYALTMLLLRYRYCQEGGCQKFPRHGHS
jgi:protein disulfide isomerase